MHSASLNRTHLTSHIWGSYPGAYLPRLGHSHLLGSHRRTTFPFFVWILWLRWGYGAALSELPPASSPGQLRCALHSWEKNGSLSANSCRSDTKPICDFGDQSPRLDIRMLIGSLIDGLIQTNFCEACTPVLLRRRNGLELRLLLSVPPSGSVLAYDN